MSFTVNIRSEEEKTNDIIVYEKKAQASDICEKYKKVKKKADLVTFASAVVFSCAAFPVFYKFYDGESILGMILTVLGAAALVIAARLCCGAFLSRSLSTFVQWGSLCSKWTAARCDMHLIEEKLADQNAFEDDVNKTEKRLIDLSEKLIAFAKERNITIDE